MNILLSAFACAPNRGSEPGVGWNWAIALARQGHNVTVATQRRHQKTIETFPASELPFNLNFRYIDLLGTGDIPWGTIGHYIYYYIWQLKLLLHFAQGRRYADYDVLHHLTYGGIRTGTLLGFLPRPLILGPLGGGESSTLRLAYGLGKSSFFKEMARNALNYLYRIDPLALFTQARAIRIFAKTPETRALILPIFRRKCSVLIEIGSPAEKNIPVRVKTDQIRLLYVGRLLPWKGISLLLGAIEKLKEPGNFSLTIVGDGKEAAKVDAAIKNSKVEITRIDKLPQIDLFNLYREADLFVFPSLHDSSGNVVLEALTFGLPIICLDRGGPPIITGKAGRIVSTQKRSHKEVIDDLARAIEDLAAASDAQEQLRTLAFERARELSWEAATKAAYADFPAL